MTGTVQPSVGGPLKLSCLPTTYAVGRLTTVAVSACIGRHPARWLLHGVPSHLSQGKVDHVDDLGRWGDRGMPAQASEACITIDGQVRLELRVLGGASRNKGEGGGLELQSWRMGPVLGRAQAGAGTSWRAAQQQHTQTHAPN